MGECRDIALGLAERHGFAVFPLVARDKVPFKGTHGFKDATSDPVEIERAFAAHPGCNSAVACGKVSGELGIIDLDLDEDGGFDGRDELADWQAVHGKLPETACVVTGRGGSHLYFRFPDGTPDSYKNEVAHVDFRGEKGYAMLPGSTHPNGNQVYWDLDPDEMPIAVADENVMAFVERYRPNSEAGGAGGDDAGERKRFELPDELHEGARDETLYRWACSERAKNTPYDVALTAMQAYNANHCHPPLPESIVQQKLDSAYKHPAGTSFEQKVDKVPEGGGVDYAPSIWDNPHLEPKRDSSGNIVGYCAPTVPALVWWLEHDDELAGIRLERMSQRVVVEGGLPWDEDVRMWRSVDDDYLFARMQELYKHGGKSLVRSDKNVGKALSIFSSNNGYDALTDMLDGLPDWDGKPRRETLLIDCLGAEDTEYTREVTKLLLRAAVARAYEPGCKYDYMVVLQGPQGIGKSTLLRLLAMRDELFVDDVKNIGSKDAQELIQGRWFVEIAELAAFKGKQVETLKSFVSSQKDSYRVPYAKRPEQLPRRCVLVGTTNLNEYLVDPTGNRRFMPVICIGKATVDIFGAGFSSYVEQVWAETLSDYRANPKRPLVLPRSVEEQASKMRASATAEDSWIGMVSLYLAGKKPGEPVCTMQVLTEGIGIEKDRVEKKDNMRVSSIITHHCHDWKRCSSNRVIPGYGPQRAFEKKTPAEIEAERNGVQECVPGV